MNFENAVLNIQTDTTINISFRVVNASEIEKFEAIIDEAKRETEILATSVGASYAYVSARNRQTIGITISFNGGRSNKMINQTVAQVAIILGRFDGRMETAEEDREAERVAEQQKAAKKPKAAKVQEKAKVETKVVEAAPIIVPAPAPAPAKKKRVVKHPTEGMNPRQIAAWKKKMAERLVAARAVKAINDAARKAQRTK
jgi:hypothetical protein